MYLVIPILVIVIPILLFAIKLIQLAVGRKHAVRELEELSWQNPGSLEQVASVEIIPLVEMKTDNFRLKTEPGVSYFIKAGKKNILMDIGFNKKKEHPSPLVHNASLLGIDLSSLDILFFSHLHLDHVGGMKEARTKTFSFTQGPTDLSDISIYAPEAIEGSHHNPTEPGKILFAPEIIAPGVASTGSVPRYLFIQGHTVEQGLAVNLKGKGLVIIVGCGHQTIERILEDAARTFNIPIYAVVGGLHYPVHGGRIMVGPLNLQALAGSDRMPWKSITEEDVTSAIDALKKHQVKKIFLSAHDSSDWALEEFKKAFGESFKVLMVGEKIQLK